MSTKSIMKNLSREENEKTEKIARDKVERRFGLLKHFLVYIVINGLLLGIDHGFTTRGDWSYIPLFLWGIAFFGHGLLVIFGDFLSDWKERQVEKEIEKSGK